VSDSQLTSQKRKPRNSKKIIVKTGGRQGEKEKVLKTKAVRPRRPASGGWEVPKREGRTGKNRRETKKERGPVEETEKAGTNCQERGGEFLKGGGSEE